MLTLNPAQRRALKARAHHLQPVVLVGDAGLTPTVLREIDINLKSHELIKIRVFGDDRAARAAMIEAICTPLNAVAVQHIGKILVLFRPRPAEEPASKSLQRRELGSATKKSLRPPKPGSRTAKPGPRRTKRSFQG
ncbi:MAG: ribosome assembly RNA-binding protein YhbY [Burkholderiales bacterium]|jgi:putative YhbY family RNA-binding protein|nr:ribosome assembly RNA-binding protein YhbY [Burkholderiales bacterium]